MLLKKILVLCGMFLLVFGNLFCSESNSKTPRNTEKIPAMSIDEVLAEYKESLLALPGVVGTAESLCEGQPCIKVYVVKRTANLDKQIGDLLKNHLFQIQTSGKIKTRPAEP